MKAIPILLLATLLLFPGAGCEETSSSNGASSPAYQDISSEELQALMEEKDDLLLVDVREAYEFEEGYIPGAILRPLGQLKDNPETLDPERTIVLICRSGRRSSDAARFLTEKGYERVYNLEGGMQDWCGPMNEPSLSPG